MEISDAEVAQFRNDTPGTQHLIHFNNAGTSLPVTPVLNVISHYFQQEAILGGYEAEAQFQKELDNTYNLIAQLINAKPEEITLVENASSAWCIAFHGIDFQPGDEVLISEFEYVTNMIGYLYGEKHYKIVLKVIPNDENGNFSITSLKASITNKTKLIAVTHIASATGGVLPVEEIGTVAAERGILYLVDACQSVGQIPVDVDKIKCDFLSVTGRKYLRAPRGTGFLYVRTTSREHVTPLFIDGHSTTFINDSYYTLREDGKRYEFYERNRALTLGLSQAVAYALNIGINRIWDRISYLAAHLRTALKQIPGISIHDSGDQQCGIVTFSIEGHKSADIKTHLSQHHINVSVGLAQSTVLYMQKHELDTVVRASVHYYNTIEEISQFLGVLNKRVAGKL